MAKRKASTAKNSKTIEIIGLPPLKTFFSRVSMAPSQEKGQISEVRVESGKPGTQTHKEYVIYANKEFLEGIHPNQATFIFNALLGGTGSARSDRHLGFANWVSNVVNSELFPRMVGGLNPAKYNVIVEYKQRGGTIMWSLSELISWCEQKAQSAMNSEARFPHVAKLQPKKTRSKKTAEVSVTL